MINMYYKNITICKISDGAIGTQYFYNYLYINRDKKIWKYSLYGLDGEIDYESRMGYKVIIDELKDRSNRGLLCDIKSINKKVLNLLVAEDQIAREIGWELILKQHFQFQ